MSITTTISPPTSTLTLHPLTSIHTAQEILQSPSFLQLLHAKFPGLSPSTTLQGESHTILRFDHAPLSSLVRITTGRPNTPYIHVLNDTEHTERTIRLDNDCGIAALKRHIVSALQRRRQDDAKGTLQPVPLSDADLVHLLQSGCYAACPRFGEAKRAIDRGCLLDAVVELFAPFALGPVESNGEAVTFRERALWRSVPDERGYVEPVKVSRLFRRAGETEEDEGWGWHAQGAGFNMRTAVCVANVRTFSPTQAYEDRERLLPAVWEEAGVRCGALESAVGVKVLVYDLSKRADVVALVQRVLLMRDCVLADKLPFEQSRWVGKQDTRVYTSADSVPDPRVRPCGAAFWERKEMGRRSCLRVSLTPERVSEGELGRKEVVIRVKRQWDSLRVDVLGKCHAAWLAMEEARMEKELQEESSRYWVLQQIREHAEAQALQASYADDPPTPIAPPPPEIVPPSPKRSWAELDDGDDSDVSDMMQSVICLPDP